MFLLNVACLTCMQNVATKKCGKLITHFFIQKVLLKSTNTTLLSLFLGLIFKVKCTLYLHYVYMNKNGGNNYEINIRQSFQPLITVLIHKYYKYTCTHTHTHIMGYIIHMCYYINTYIILYKYTMSNVIWCTLLHYM